MTDEQRARILPQDEGLASRLSRLAVSCDAFLSEQDGPTCREAAQALTAKDAEIEELEARLEASQDALSSTLERLHLQAKRIAELEGALQKIELIDLQWACGLDVNVERIKSIARAALTLKEQEIEG